MAALALPNPRLSIPETVLPSIERGLPETANDAEYLEVLHKHFFENMASLLVGQITALDSDFAPLERQLDQLGGLTQGWDGYNAPLPSAQAIEESRQILQRMQEQLVTPQWVSASAEGGVAFSFRSTGDRRAEIEILNSGEKFAHLYDLNGDSRTEEWAENLEGQRFDKLLRPILDYLQI
jgi:hypothetical protein